MYKNKQKQPLQVFKVKSIIKYTLLKEISVNIIFYYNKSHISLTYNSIRFQIVLTYVRWNCTMVTCIITKILRIMNVKTSGKREIKLVRFKIDTMWKLISWKNGTKKWKIDKQLNSKVLEIILWFYEFFIRTLWLRHQICIIFCWVYTCIILREMLLNFINKHIKNKKYN